MWGQCWATYGTCFYVPDMREDWTVDLGLKRWLGPGPLTDSKAKQWRWAWELSFILRRIVEFEGYLPNELCNWRDSGSNPHFPPYQLCDLRQVILPLWVSSRVKWDNPWILKLYCCSPGDFIHCQVWTGKEGHCVQPLVSSFISLPQSLAVGQFMLGRFWGWGSHFWPLCWSETYLYVTCFAHTDLSSSPVLQVCKDSPLLSLLYFRVNVPSSLQN